MRVGIGYDIHRLEAGRGLVLGGVDIPSPAGLVGHSDADVLLHALMDALLGAASLGDIGRHFPPDDDRYNKAASLELLRQVGGMVRRRGFTPANVDLVLVAERPRIAPHVDDMRRRIAEALAISSDRVSIKATTNEGVGPEGRFEAMSAQAVALLEGPL